jgi:hypothetical protein
MLMGIGKWAKRISTKPQCKMKQTLMIGAFEGKGTHLEFLANGALNEGVGGLIDRRGGLADSKWNRRCKIVKMGKSEI